jgi:pimeloyl-ACP methyl ester carboxylesterase
MNLIREAVGDPVLNYIGLSYGTGLGAIYANLFPSTVGRMILDANVNPVTWTMPEGDLPTFLRLDTDTGNASNMAAFLRLCGETTTASCAFSAGTPAATQAKWNTLLSRVSQQPITLTTPPITMTYADVIASVPLTDVSAWQSGASLLQKLWLASEGSGSTARPATAKQAKQAKQKATAKATAKPASSGGGDWWDQTTPSTYVGLEQNLAVLCTDSPNPRNPNTFAAEDNLAYARSGGFGLYWLWTTEPCAQWPGIPEDRYTGPWNRQTAHTILLLGNTGDTDLPYQDTLAMYHDLGNAELLTVDGYGHTEADNLSTCALNYELSFEQTGILPPVGTVCQEDSPPFPAP